MQIDTWDDAFASLWQQAAARHGLRENLSEHPARQMFSNNVPQWPRTRGIDVLAIAALLEPLLGTTPIESGAHAVERKWRYCADQLHRDAASDLAREYRHNQAFWSAVVAVVAYLASIGASVPEHRWRSLLADLAIPDPPRSSTGVTDQKVELAAVSYDELWHAQKAALAKLRGSDVREATTTILGGRMSIPRTTNADILQLATYWTYALAEVEIQHRAIGVDTSLYAGAVGLDGETRRWHTALADVDTYAQHGDPNATYPRNDEFWRASGSLSITLAVIAEAPAPFELVLDAAIDRPTIRNAHYDGEGTNEAMWDRFHDDLVKTRDADAREAPAGQVGAVMQIPRTTNADILQLAPYWLAAWKRLDDRRRWLGMEWLSHLPTQQGLDAQQKRWEAVLHDVETIAKSGQPTDVYPKNHEFWRETHTLAVTLDLFHEAPTKADLAIDIAKGIPERIGEVIQDVTNAVGNVAKQAGKGLLAGLGPQLLIGGGVVLGLVLLLRHSKPAAQLAAAAV